MQPAKFNLLQTKTGVRLVIVKNAFHLDVSASLALISPVTTESNKLSEISKLTLGETDNSSLCCSMTTEGINNSHNASWVQPVEQNPELCDNFTDGGIHMSGWKSDLANGTIFSTTLTFNVRGITAGIYMYDLKVPLLPNGTDGRVEFQIMSVELVVRGRVCANRSCIKIARVQEHSQATPCGALNMATDQQDDRLRVKVEGLTDITGLRIASDLSKDAHVDLATPMHLRLCSVSKCEKMTMSFNGDHTFSSQLPPLQHAGSYTLTIQHGSMPGCMWTTAFDAKCKEGSSPNKALECVFAEEDSATLVC